MDVYRTLARIVGQTLRSADRPMGAHMVVTRRCNLSCGYCNEYDDASPPVPFDKLAERISYLARLGTGMVSCTGGEPLLHPRIADIVRAIKDSGMTAAIITNGYPLTRTRIEDLNKAKLDVLQISIDNLVPCETSSKSLSAVASRVSLLAEAALFEVNINSVLGRGIRSTDVAEIARWAKAHGFANSVGLMHASGGGLRPLSAQTEAAYREIASSLPHRVNYWLFQRRLIQGRPCRWKCRAGARFLYVDEHGCIHWCSQRRDTSGIPLHAYGVEHIRRAFRTKKACSPYCTLSCVHHASALDGWRRQDLPDPSVAARPSADPGSKLLPVLPSG